MYIHQLSTWPELNWDSKPLLPLLSEIRYKQGRLLGHMQSLGFDLQKEAQLEILSQDIIASNAIEGEFLSSEDVRSSLANRLGIQTGLPPAKRHVEGIVTMMMNATQQYLLPVTEERLFQWHAMLFPTARDNFGRKMIVGNWRQSPMQVVSGNMGEEHLHFEAPKAGILSAEMTLFLKWLNEKEIEPVLKSAIAHLWFVTIHPFDDGNGRIARAISDLLLAHSDKTHLRFYSLSEQIRIDKKSYYQELERAQKGDLNITHWLLWFLKSLNQALDASKILLSKIFIRANFWKKHHKLNVNDRQKKMLTKLLDTFQGKLNTSKWAKMTKCSQDTAHRDIKDLITYGILEKEEGGGRSTSYRLCTDDVTWFW